MTATDHAQHTNAQHANAQHTDVQPPRGSAGVRNTPLWKLTVVELRKVADTRAGAWLLAIVGLLAVAVVVIVAIAGDATDLTFAGLLAPTVLPGAILLPVLGILSVTSEWSQRTALTTFALVPRRSRTAVAKLLAALVLALLSISACIAAAAVANLFAGGDGSWHIPAFYLGRVALYQVLYVLLGLAFGMLLMSPSLAIVLYFVLPTAWSILGSLISALRTTSEWLDLSVTAGLLLENEMTGRSWARLGASVALWVLTPMIVGLIRLRRREVA